MPTLAAITAEDKKMIKAAYARLLRSIKSDLDKEDQENIKKAYNLAVSAHGDQRRKSGEPYVTHPLEVARICVTEIGLGPTAIIGAILHDVVEDTEVTMEEIFEMFGPKITRIVDGLTKLDGLYNVESPQAENFKKVISTLVEDVRVVLIKMADRLHNLRTIGVMPVHKKLRIASETSFIYAPLAHRLGLYNLKTEFEDICLKITEPDIYKKILENLDSSKKEREKYVNAFIRPLKKGLDAEEIPYRILGRPKAVSSIWGKIKKKKVPIEQIYDLFAIRVILDVPLEKEKKSCWEVYSVVTDVYKPIPERLKDWVTTPKSNGYESLHTTVVGPKGKFVEVQIRTERMHDIAERGFAAHWKYKDVQDGKPNLYDSWLDNVRELLDANGEANSLEFISDFKTNLFSKEVFVYTPNGDMRVLPHGATALDFAFFIHTDVGYHATSIKVNNKLVPMGYKLKNGDRLEVITNKNQRPKEDWLKMVVTGKARSKIRSSMKEERRKQGELGREGLIRKLKNMKVDFDDGVDVLIKHFKLNSKADLFFGFAMETLSFSELKKFNVENHKLVLKEEEKPEVIIADEDTIPVQKINRSALTKILVNGEPAEQYNYSYAMCCNPLPGDKIFAYLAAASGLKIHRTNCSNATHLIANYGYRTMKAEWVAAANSSFVAELTITGVDDGPGVIERITTTISSTLGINIRSFSISGKEGYFEGKVSLVVSNKDQLNKIIMSLKKLDNISSVVRSDGRKS